MLLVFGRLVRALFWIPRALVRPVAWRYIAGETRAELLRLVLAVHDAGLLSTVDLLGENSTSEELVEAATEEYLRLIDGLSDNGVPSQVSIKPTLMGLRLGEDLSARALSRIAAHAEERGISVALDMEDSTTTDATLRLFRLLRERHCRVSVAIQACLLRSVNDLKSLLPLRPAVRVCKGIYVEPESIALKDRHAIRENYLRLVATLLDGGGYPAMATHDPYLVERCLALVSERKEASASHEFQMLLGVGGRLRSSILGAGSPLRIYCPYGPDWHRYSLRRLKENPRILGHVLRSLLVPGRRDREFRAR